jgi:hypothetical protein
LSQTQPSREMRRRYDIDLRLFVLGFVWTLLQLPLGLHEAGFGRYYELATVAKNVAASGQFGDPFGIATGPTAQVAPVYPLILALAIKIFKGAYFVPAMILLNAVLYGLTAAWMPIVSQRVYGDTRPGVAGGVLLAFSGWLMPQWEVALSSLLLLLATLAILERGPVQAGLWSGVSVLANPSSFPALVLMAGFRRTRFAVTAVAIALILCAPWVLRNRSALGAPYFIRDNLGLEMWLSNSDQSSPETVTNWPLWNLHPNRNPDEAQVVAAMGEGRYNQMRMKDARAWIWSHPRQFLKLSAARAFYYWLPAPREGWPAYLCWIITVLGAWGIWMSRKNRLAMSLAGASLLYSLTFLVTATHIRHRFPSLWMFALLAGCAAVRIRSLIGPAGRAKRDN